MRSFDAKKLYHLPEIGLVRGAAPSRRTTEGVSLGQERIPIHRAYYEQADSGIFVAYMLVYNSKPVANPYLAQVLSFPRQLVRGTAPMNLFFVTGRGASRELDEMEKNGIAWLVESLGRYRSLCR